MGFRSQCAVAGILLWSMPGGFAGRAADVGVYVDESPISIGLFTPDLELFDLDRIEVLRGPQGTLFGAGSAAGTVRYITTQPKLGDSKPLRMRRSNAQKAAASAAAAASRSTCRWATSRPLALSSTSTTYPASRRDSTERQHKKERQRRRSVGH